MLTGSGGSEVHGEAAHCVGQHHLPDRPRRLAAAGGRRASRIFLLAAENALDKIRDLYWAKGYNDVRSDYALVQDRATGQVDVVVHDHRRPAERHRRDHDRRQRQGQRAPRAGTDSAGRGAAARSQCARQIAPEPLRHRCVLGGRHHATRTVPESGSTDGSQGTPQEKPVPIDVQLREVQPIQIRYGASYDTERGVGGIFDISNHNSLGGAREIGLRSRYDRQLHEGRIYFNQPALTYLPKTTASIYLREELNPPTELTDPFDMSRKGVSIQQEMKLEDRYVLSIRIQARASPHADADHWWRHPRRSADPVAAHEHADARNARRYARCVERDVPIAGIFIFAGLARIRSAVRQVPRAVLPLLPAPSTERKPFTNEILRPRLVYRHRRSAWAWRRASAAWCRRASASTRAAAPRCADSDRTRSAPSARTAFRSAARPCSSSTTSCACRSSESSTACVFLDIGNVYDRVSNISLTDLRKSTGVGLRVRTPWVLLRGDYGS